jgi:signal transduction histidine kinase
MGKWSRELSTPRGLLIVVGTVVALPAFTLVFLGVRLLQQDRLLSDQRRTRGLDDAADRVVRAIDADLTALQRSLADPGWVPRDVAGAVRVVITPAGVTVDPPNALAYFPMVSPLPELPTEPFAALERAEHQPGGLALALQISRPLATSSDPSIRAGALLRQARILRKMGRSREALSLYDDLTAFPTLSINGLPADLQARKTRCALLQETSAASDLRREAAALERDFDAGRWRLDRANYEYVTGLLDTWLERGPRSATEREARAAGVDWLFHAQGREPGGAKVIEIEGMPMMLVWSSLDTRLAALVGGPVYVRTEWLARAQRAASPAEISLLPPTQTRSASTAPGTVSRSAAITGLPWSIALSLAPDHDAGQLESRRRTLLVALAAVFVLVGAGSYLIVRARKREIALAHLQSDFVAAVSHEFRTPLTSLRQFNALLDDDGELAPETLRNYHTAQTRATERLHRLVESLLDFGRMEAGKRQYTLERLDAALLVRDVVEEFKQEHSGLALRCAIGEGEHAVEGDSEALARALWNLLDNAVKYSGNSREVDVTVSLSLSRVLIAVRDRGIGIPAAEQGRIFEKFSRGSAATARHIRGTGIGLAMVQHIAQAHGGTVGVESVENGGSTFTISLPAIPALGPRTHTAAHTNAGTHAT